MYWCYYVQYKYLEYLAPIRIARTTLPRTVLLITLTASESRIGTTSFDCWGDAGAKRLDYTLYCTPVERPTCCRLPALLNYQFVVTPDNPQPQSRCFNNNACCCSAPGPAQQLCLFGQVLRSLASGSRWKRKITGTASSPARQ